MAEVYKHFSKIQRCSDAPTRVIKIWDEYDSFRDFSEEALEEAYRKETFGEDFDVRRENGKINGYIEGKQKMDLTITDYWLPDLKEGKTLFKHELYEDENLPDWFLDRVLK